MYNHRQGLVYCIMNPEAKYQFPFTKEKVASISLLCHMPNTFFSLKKEYIVGGINSRCVAFAPAERSSYS